MYIYINIPNAYKTTLIIQKIDDIIKTVKQQIQRENFTGWQMTSSMLNVDEGQSRLLTFSH